MGGRSNTTAVHRHVSSLLVLNVWRVCYFRLFNLLVSVTTLKHAVQANSPNDASLNQQTLKKSKKLYKDMDDRTSCR